MDPSPDVTDTVKALVVQSNFNRFTAKTLPGTDIIEDTLFSTCSCVVRDILHALADSAPRNGNGATQIEHDILRDKISNVIEFPQNLANFIGINNMEGEGKHGRFDYEMYNQKLADVFWRWLSSAGKCDAAAEQRQVFARTFACVAVRRGFSPPLFARFLMQSSVPCDEESKGDAARDFMSRIQPVTAGVLDGAVNRAVVLRKTGATMLRLTGAWAAWLQTLMTAAERAPAREAGVTAFFVDNMAVAENTNDDTRNPNEQVPLQIRDYVLSTALAKQPTLRAHLRFIYTRILPVASERLKKTSEQVLPRTLDHAFQRVLATWNSDDLVENGVDEMNEAIFHSVMYALLFLKDAKWTTLPSALLTPLLSGVTARLRCAHAERQTYGMAAAAAFAAFFVDNSEAAESVLQNTDFSLHLQKWLSEEATQVIKAAPSSPASASPSTARPDTLFVRAEILPPDAAKPLDPDAPHYFFLRQDNSKVTREKMPVVARDAHQSVTNFSSSEVLPAFGVQKLDEDESDVSILHTFRESYESVMGIGKGANTQMHETQQAIEAGLYGMAKSLTLMKKQLAQNGVNVKFSTQLDPLIPSLLPVLMSLSIYAPEDKTKMLYGVRYNIIVDLVQLSTKLSLHSLSGMVYGSNYGIYQRVEIVKAIGDAARALASLEIHESSAENQANSSAFTGSAQSGKPVKRVYPPIPTAGLTEKRSIILDEGKHTRRWGNAVQSRMNAKAQTRRYLNVLSDTAHFFISSLLTRLDADHFKFFQEADPYVPAEILRTLVTVFQGISKARHVAPSLCERNIDFFYAADMHHPHLVVRKQAWIATGEVMRCWCGAPPALEANPNGYSSKHGLTYSGSLMFAEAWLNSLEILHSFCVELDRKKDPAAGVAALTVATLRDLVFEQKDLDAMMSSHQGGIVAL